MQENVCFNKLRVKEFCSKQSSLCTSRNKAYVMALKFAFKCTHLMDERNGIDGTDYWILRFTSVLRVTKVWFSMSGEIFFCVTHRYSVLLCENLLLAVFTEVVSQNFYEVGRMNNYFIICKQRNLLVLSQHLK